MTKPVKRFDNGWVPVQEWRDQRVALWRDLRRMPGGHAFARRLYQGQKAIAESLMNDIIYGTDTSGLSGLFL